MSAILSHSLSHLTPLAPAQVKSTAEDAVAFIVNGFKHLSADPAPSFEGEFFLVESLAKIFSESARRNHNEAMMLRQLSPYSFLVEGTTKILVGVYIENLSTITSHTPARPTLSCEYSGFDWRLSCEVARRSVRKIARPVFDVRVDTTGSTVMGENPLSGNGGGFTFMADGGQMNNLREKLMEAIDEEKGQHGQRFHRYMN